MTPLFPELPHPLGVYTLTRLLMQRAGSEVYAASQSHVEREVALELLRPAEGAEAAEAAFVAMARARVAAAGLPHVGQVYESLCVDGYWFLTQELPTGTGLAQPASASQKRSVLTCARIIAAVAELYAACEAAGCAVLPPESAGIFIGKAVQCLSPVLAGRFDPAAVAEHQRTLAAAVAAVAPAKGPGTTRLRTLLGWLREGYEGRTLSWSEVAQTAQMLTEQLDAAPAPAPAAPSSAGRRRARGKEWRRRLRPFAAAACCVALTVGIASLGLLFRSGRTIQHRAISSEGIACQAGQGVCLLAATPVSVAQYSAFFKEQGSPAELRPVDWERQQQLPNEPVVGVTRAQAAAYARARGAALPTLAQLQAAFRAGAQHPLREWSADTVSGDACGLAEPDAPLAIAPAAPFTPIPLPRDPAYADAQMGFRTATPTSTQPNQP